MTFTRLSLCSILAASSAVAQGTFTTFGQGCAWQNQVASIGNASLPTLGQPLTITYSGPNFVGSAGQQIAQPVLVLGIGQQTLQLPTSILRQQPSGCTALITVEALLPAAFDPIRPVFIDRVDIPIPNRPVLLGVSFFAQWATRIDQCGFAGCDLTAVITSNAAIATIQ